LVLESVGYSAEAIDLSNSCRALIRMTCKNGKFPYDTGKAERLFKWKAPQEHEPLLAVVRRLAQLAGRCDLAPDRKSREVAPELPQRLVLFVRFCALAAPFSRLPPTLLARTDEVIE
jgi:hypothetical protein